MILVYDSQHAMRTNGILASVLTALLCSAACGGPSGPDGGAMAPEAARSAGGLADGPPFNVVLVVFDALRADRLSLYGNPRRTSPYLDSVARYAVVCRQAYSQAPWTAPSMASLFTSTYQSVHQVTHLPRDDMRFSVLSDELTTLAELYSDAGYRTAAFSSQAWLLPETGFAQGFEEFHKVSGIEDLFEAERVVESGMGWIGRHRQEPFFLYLHVLNPHSPYRAPPPFDELWWRDGVPERFRAMEGMNIDQRWEFLLSLGEEGVSDEELAYLLAMYDGEISHADYWFGRLARLLGDLGLHERTILVLTSDHGESFSEHGQFGHAGRVYNDQLHVPLVLINPRLFPEPVEITGPVELVDLLPTLAVLTGLPVPAQAQGEDLLGGELPGVAFAEGAKLRQQKLQDAVWSLIASDGFQSFELFDLRSDPGETRNLWQERPQAGERMRRALAARIRANRSHPDRVEPQVRALDEDVVDELKALGYLR